MDRTPLRTVAGEKAGPILIHSPLRGEGVGGGVSGGGGSVLHNVVGADGEGLGGERG